MVTRKSRASQDEERPSTARRSILTGSALGLAAVAGASIGGASSASAQSTAPSVTDWLNVTNAAYGAKGDGTTDDFAAITNALQAAKPGQVVYLPSAGTNTAGGTITGQYLITQPLVILPGVCLRGPTPVNDDAGRLTADNYGAAIQVAPHASSTLPTWRGNPSLSHQGALVLMPTGSNSTLYRPAVENLWIDGSANSTDLIDGIASIGSVFHALIRNVGVWTASGNGIAAYSPSTGTTPRADAWEVDSCILQSCRGNGVSFFGQDTIFQAVHAQGCTNDGFYIQRGNNRLIGQPSTDHTGRTRPDGHPLPA